MKTSKIITSIAALSVILFVSVASIANSSFTNTGDIVKARVKNQTGIGKAISTDLPSTVSSEKEFDYLRFDVARFIGESEVVDLTMNLMDNLRFDVNDFIGSDKTAVLEMPVVNEFEYLRFDVNKFDNDSSLDLTELPSNDYIYLKFDVNSYTTNNSGDSDEIPAS